MEKDLFETENDKNPFLSFLKEGETESPESKKTIPPMEQNISFLSPLFIELIHGIKSSLGSIKNLTHISRVKFSEKEFGEYFYRMVTEDIEKIDLVLNGLLNYIRISNPIKKADTIRTLIEEVLKEYEIKLEENELKVFKKFEQDLPETTVPDDQLRYILNSVIQYAISSRPPNGSIGILTKSFLLQKESGEGQTIPKKNGRYIEILVVFPGYKRAMDQFGKALGIPIPEKEELLNLELRLVKEIVQKYRGMMKFEVDEKKGTAFISIRLPAERRKVVYYPSPNK